MIQLRLFEALAIDWRFMNKFKQQIIKYFILCTLGISVCESVKDSLFDDLLFPLYIDNVGISSILMTIYILSSIVIFVLFAFVFYRLTNYAVEKESKRQVNERNMLYACITHDLKTPMTSVQGFAAALRDDRIKDEEQKEIYDIIYNKSCYMNDLVESMFAYSKLNTEDYQLLLRKIDLGVLVRDLVALNYDEFEKRKIDLVIEIPQEPIPCLLDEKEMKRAVNNLIVNAYTHNPDNTAVLIRVAYHGKNVCVTIADNGKKISKEEELKLFDPFMCGDDARSSGQGNGLGLTISRIIIEKHGGKLYVKNNIDGYTKGFVVQDLNLQ